MLKRTVFLAFFFLKVVILHNKLKGMKFTTPYACKQIFCSNTHPWLLVWVQNVKTFFSVKLKGKKCRYGCKGLTLHMPSTSRVRLQGQRFWNCADKCILLSPRLRRRDIVLASSVHASVRPFRPSVRNHISVPIGQIWFILGTNDKYHGLSNIQ